MNNKIYPFIIINKNDMVSGLDHRKDADRTALAIINGRLDFKPSQWVVIKNEKTVVDFSELTVLGADQVTRFRKLVSILEKA